MLDVIAEKIKNSFGKDLHAGLMGMFLILHFYYAIPAAGWLQSVAGIAAVIVSVVIASVISFWAGNAVRSVFTLVFLALSLDFFYHGQAVNSGEFKHFLFEYLWNGPAVVNFASFGLATVWMHSQLDPQP